jgi:hypothetical protein
MDDDDNEIDEDDGEITINLGRRQSFAPAVAAELAQRRKPQPRRRSYFPDELPEDDEEDDGSDGDDTFAIDDSMLVCGAAYRDLGAPACLVVILKCCVVDQKAAVISQLCTVLIFFFLGLLKCTMIPGCRRLLKRRRARQRPSTPRPWRWTSRSSTSSA